LRLGEGAIPATLLE